MGRSFLACAAFVVACGSWVQIARADEQEDRVREKLQAAEAQIMELISQGREKEAAALKERIQAAMKELRQQAATKKGDKESKLEALKETKEQKSPGEKKEVLAKVTKGEKSPYGDLPGELREQAEKIKHLHQAAVHLKSAGMLDLSAELARKANEAEGQLQQAVYAIRRSQEEKSGKGDKVEAPKKDKESNELREMREEIQRLRRELEELRRK